MIRNGPTGIVPSARVPAGGDVPAYVSVALASAALTASGRSAEAAIEAAPAKPPLAPLGRRRPTEATLRIAVVREGIFLLEDFIDSLDFAATTERSRLKLAGSEIFDNLVKHSTPIEGGSAIVRAARRSGVIYLIFGFKSPSFAAYVQRCRDYEPVFDHHARRWHGMGLRMTRNLSSSLLFRPGSLVDRVIIRF
ncbi:MAG TPA: hypothetical protein VMV44_09065 [Rectinemataceae bacterium]|nr:hypothetical protein [Rectinemataceae bacterium]